MISTTGNSTLDTAKATHDRSPRGDAADKADHRRGDGAADTQAGAAFPAVLAQHAPASQPKDAARSGGAAQPAAGSTVAAGSDSTDQSGVAGANGTAAPAAAADPTDPAAPGGAANGPGAAAPGGNLLPPTDPASGNLLPPATAAGAAAGTAAPTRGSAESSVQASLEALVRLLNPADGSTRGDGKSSATAAGPLLALVNDGGSAALHVRPDTAAPQALLPASPPPTAIPLDARPSPAAAGVSQPTPQPPLLPGDAQFASALGQRLMSLVQQGAQDARLHVHPEHLGPIHVHLRLDGNAADVTFSSPHAPVRDALQQSLPRLRDLLGDVGLNLQNAAVHDQQAQTSQQHQGGRPGIRPLSAVDEVLEEDPAVFAASSPRTGLGIRLLDTFA